jgi:SAM-dependent methyltransferase
VPEPRPARIPCDLCGAETRYAFTTTDRNRALSNRRFTYDRCVRCGTYALRDVPFDLGAYYPPEYYGSEDRAVLAAAAASAIEQGKLGLVRPYASGGALVEIGPGGGQFALAASNAGFSVTSIEMDADACERLERLVGVPAIHSAEPELVLAGLPPSDVIAMWHVLEHLPRPRIALERAANNLRPGGVLALAVPNPASLQFRLLRGRWAHVDAPRHLFLLPLRAVSDAVAEHGLELASATSADAAGRHWNRFGWEYALRRFPARRPGSRFTRALAGAIDLAISPVERCGLAGATYSAVFVKRR